MPEGLAEILRAGRATTAGAPLPVAPAVLAGIALDGEPVRGLAAAWGRRAP